MPHFELTSRERVRLALAHRETDRVPIALVCSGINPPVDAELDAFLRRECGLSLAQYLEELIDIRSVEPVYCGPKLGPGEDIWGVRRGSHPFGVGAYDEIEYYPLALAETSKDLDRHRWPCPEWFDYPALESSIARAQAGGEKCLMIHNANLFETAWYMRGFEQIFLDFYLNPEFILDLMERVTRFYIAHFRRMLEIADGRVDLAFTADEIGGQNGLLMSLNSWETFIKPFHTRLNQTIHEFGVKVIYHSDGAVMDAVPGLLEMGIDVLQALQFSAKGMDPQALKDRFGERLCFEGGVSVQTTLPFGTVEEVRREVANLKNILGKNGGYILGPSHAIQAGTPVNNVYAMFEEAASF